MRSAEAYSWGKCHDAAGYRVYGGVAIVATPITAQKHRDSSRMVKENAALPIMGRTGMVNDYP